MGRALKKPFLLLFKNTSSTLPPGSGSAAGGCVVVEPGIKYAGIKYAVSVDVTEAVMAFVEEAAVLQQCNENT